MKTFKFPVNVTVEVEARTEASARRKAARGLKEMNNLDIGWTCGMAYGAVTVASAILGQDQGAQGAGGPS